MLVRQCNSWTPLLYHILTIYISLLIFTLTLLTTTIVVVYSSAHRFHSRIRVHMISLVQRGYFGSYGIWQIDGHVLRLIVEGDVAIHDILLGVYRRRRGIGIGRPPTRLGAEVRRKPRRYAATWRILVKTAFSAKHRKPKNEAHSISEI